MNGLLELVGNLPRILGNVIVLEKALLKSNLKGDGNLKVAGKVFIESKRLKVSTLALENKLKKKNTMVSIETVQWSL